MRRRRRSRRKRKKMRYLRRWKHKCGLEFHSSFFLLSSIFLAFICDLVAYFLAHMLSLLVFCSLFLTLAFLLLSSSHALFTYLALLISSFFFSLFPYFSFLSLNSFAFFHSFCFLPHSLLPLPVTYLLLFFYFSCFSYLLFPSFPISCFTHLFFASLLHSHLAC